MKMKNNLFVSLFLVGLLVVASNQVSAQLMIKAGAGYGAGTQRLLLETVTGAGYVENINGSFGGNLGLNLGVGYELTRFIDLEFDMGYQHGRSIAADQPFLYKTYIGRLIYLGPSLVFKTAIDEDLSPYGRLGVFTGLPLTRVLVGGTEKRFTGGIPFGYSGALGLDYALVDNLKFFTEIYSQSMLYKPTRRRELDGTVVKFSDKLSTPFSANQEMKHHLFSFGALGINVGFKIII